MKNFRKFLDLKFSVTKKSSFRSPSEKFSAEHSVNIKKFEKLFGLNFGITKKVGAQTPLQKIQSPEYTVNEKIPKNF